MTSIIEKYNCGNCDFWLEDPTLTPTGGAAVVMHDSGQARVQRLGHCRKDPPSMVMIPSAHPMNPQMIQMKLQRHYPITQPDEICSHHPILKADVVRGTLALLVRSYLDMLDYKPGKYPDETAAGFSRLPTLDEAKKLAQAVNEKPGAICAVSPTKIHVWHGPDSGCRYCGVPFSLPQAEPDAAAK